MFATHGRRGPNGCLPHVQNLVQRPLRPGLCLAQIYRGRGGAGTLDVRRRAAIVGVFGVEVGIAPEELVP